MFSPHGFAKPATDYAPSTALPGMHFLPAFNSFPKLPITSRRGGPSVVVRERDFVQLWKRGKDDGTDFDFGRRSGAFVATRGHS